MQKGIFISTIIFIVVVILVLRPANYTPENCKEASGTVLDIAEGPSNDIIFKLSNDPSIYYINRGLEQGFSIAGLKQLLLHKEATIFYPNHWTPLDPTGKLKGIAKLKTPSKTIFTRVNR